jgi:hypothetical protein
MPKITCLPPLPDRRNISLGRVISTDGYCDQPYLLLLKNGVWLCVLTTCSTREGGQDQTVSVLRSEDRGKTWVLLGHLEPPGGPIASWGMPFLASSGRIYVFYNYNIDNLTSVPTDPGYERLSTRLDTQGALVFRYSDDGGFTWSSERHRIPIRNFAIDLANPLQGKVQFLWGVGKPLSCRGRVYLGFAKVGRFGQGFMATSEGAFLCSPNLEREMNPEKIEWLTLPDGDIGLRAVSGDVADEHNLTYLNDGSLFCTYRTTGGFSCHAYSRDGGHTWTPPAPMTYHPGGPVVKNPRAANFVRRFANGKFLYWFHNNSLGTYAFSDHILSANRNPGWVLGGVERDGFIEWSQPEIALYADDMTEAISYPDFLEENGEIYISETQKTVARLHQLEPKVLAAVWGELEPDSSRLVIDLAAPLPQSVEIPPWPSLDYRDEHRQPSPPDHRYRGSFTMQVEFAVETLLDAPIFDSTDMSLQGVRLDITSRGTLQLKLTDSRTESAWESDPGSVREGGVFHIAAIVDGAAKIVRFIVNGVQCDGGPHRHFGWGLIHPDLRQIGGASRAVLAPEFPGRILRFKLWHRALLAAECRSIGPVVGHAATLDIPKIGEFQR